MSVIEMIATNGGSVTTRRMYSSWTTAEKDGIPYAQEWLDSEMARGVALVEQTDAIPGRRFWAEDRSGESPSLELLEWHVYGDDSDITEDDAPAPGPLEDHTDPDPVPA